MDNQALVKQIVKNLAFELEPDPKYKTDQDATTSSITTPLNIKVKVKNNEPSGQYNATFTSDSRSKRDMVLRKVRLVKSDATIMSFDMLLEVDLEKKMSRKPRKHILGLCLGGTDDDVRPYTPDINHNAENSELATDLTANEPEIKLKPQFTLSKNVQNSFTTPTIPRRETSFLGRKCKPGGCLDPPFGEDKYSYEPSLGSITKKETKDLTKSLKNDVDTKLDDTTNNKGKTSEYIRKKPVVTQIKETASNTSVRSVDSIRGSVITYPPCDRTKANRTRDLSKDKILRTRVPSEEKSRQSINESVTAFYGPPKGVKRDYSGQSDLSNNLYDSSKTIKKRSAELLRATDERKDSSCSITLNQAPRSKTKVTKFPGDFLPEQQIEVIPNSNLSKNKDVPGPHIVPVNLDNVFEELASKTGTNTASTSSIHTSQSKPISIIKTERLKLHKQQFNEKNENLFFDQGPLLIHEPSKKDDSKNHLDIISKSEKPLPLIHQNRGYDIDPELQPQLKESSTTRLQTNKNEDDPPQQLKLQTKESLRKNSRTSIIQSKESLPSDESYKPHRELKSQSEPTPSTIHTVSKSKHEERSQGLEPPSEQTPSSVHKLSKREYNARSQGLKSPSEQTSSAIHEDDEDYQDLKTQSEQTAFPMLSLSKNKRDDELSPHLKPLLEQASSPARRLSQSKHEELSQGFRPSSEQTSPPIHRLSKSKNDELSQGLKPPTEQRSSPIHKLSQSKYDELSQALKPLSEKSSSTIQGLAKNKYNEYPEDLKSQSEKTSFPMHRLSKSKFEEPLQGFSPSSEQISSPTHRLEKSKDDEISQDLKTQSELTSTQMHRLSKSKVDELPQDVKPRLKESLLLIHSSSKNILEHSQLKSESISLIQHSSTNNDDERPQEIKPESKESQNLISKKSKSQSYEYNQEFKYQSKESLSQKHELSYKNEDIDDQFRISPVQINPLVNRFSSDRDNVESKQSDRQSKEDPPQVRQTSGAKDNELLQFDNKNENLLSSEKSVIFDKATEDTVNADSSTIKNKLLEQIKDLDKNTGNIDSKTKQTLQPKLPTMDANKQDITLEQVQNLDTDNIYFQPESDEEQSKLTTNDGRHNTVLSELSVTFDKIMGNIVSDDKDKIADEIMIDKPYKEIRNLDKQTENINLDSELILQPKLPTSDNNDKIISIANDKAFDTQHTIFSKTVKGNLDDKAGINIYDSQKEHVSQASKLNIQINKTSYSPDLLTQTKPTNLEQFKDDYAQLIKNVPNAIDQSIKSYDESLLISGKQSKIIEGSYLDKDADKKSSEVKSKVSLDKRYVLDVDSGERKSETYLQLSKSSSRKDDVSDHVKEKTRPTLDGILKSNSSTVILDVAFHSYMNNENVRIIKTIDTATEVKRYPNDSLTIIKSQIILCKKENSREINIHVDSKHDMAIRISKAYEAPQNNYNKIKTKSIPDWPQTEKNILSSAGTTKDLKIGQGKSSDRDKVYSVLTAIYEQELVPLHTMMKGLKEEVDSLAAQQAAFQKKAPHIKKTKALRVVHSTKRCGPCFQ